MTKSDLFEAIANGENSGVEFKRDTLDNRSLAKELVAFANFNGGRVLLGVGDDGSIAGLTRPDLEQWVMNACRDKIRPEIIPYFEVIRDLDNRRDVAVVHVMRGFNVHHVWHDQHRTYYIRAGTQSREASPEELGRLFQQRGTIRHEVQSVSGSSIKDLDLRRLSEYFKDIRQQDAPAIEDEEEWIPLLVNTEFLAEPENTRGGLAPATVAGLLLFGRKPNRFLPQSGIDAVVYRGAEKDYDSAERLSIRGPIVRRGSGIGHI